MSADPSLLSRREMLVTPVAMMVASTASAAGKMSLAIHQNTSAAAGYRASLEGWARAGIRNVEITAALLDGFLKTEPLAAAKRVLTDNGLTPVSAACGVGGLWEPNPNHAASLDNLKRRCEQFTELGLTHIYAPVGGTQKFVEEDYKTGADQMRKVGEVAQQFRVTMMAEFTRGSSFISTLTTALRVARAAAHPNVKPLFDCYHFWSGNNKLEDLDLLKPGEIGHVHFQDVPDIPRELLDQTTRLIPGEGVSPLTAILKKLSDKGGYSGPLSVELFLPKYQQGDPYEVARDIRQKAEGVMRRAGVL
jgi:2-keto-myo-inositol isomerase